MQGRGIKPDLVAYNTAINAAGTSSCVSHILLPNDKVVDRVSRIGCSFIGLNSDTFWVCYAAGKSGDWDRTVQIFEALQATKLKPDVWTYTSLINACQSCGNDWQSGLEVFDDMEFQGVRLCMHDVSPMVLRGSP